MRIWELIEISQESSDPDDPVWSCGQSWEMDEDGTTSVVKLPVDMWNLGDRFAYRVPGTKPIRSVEVDARRALPDIDRSNNTWPRLR